jgi:uncharacterized membrane protein
MGRIRAWFSRGDAIDRTFAIAVLAKGLNGLVEILGGLALLLVSPSQLAGRLTGLANGELAEDPNDFIATRLLHWTTSTSLSDSGLRFAGLYLLSHGVVKVVLVVAVLREKLWAYPWMLAFLVGFIGYQLVLLQRHFTWGLAALTCFDVVLTWLTYREWQRHRPARPASANGEVAPGIANRAHRDAE